MFSRIIALFQKSKSWQEEIQELHQNLVPLSGEAETLQGELVRCVQNLADECYRNGWMNWDSANEEEIKILKKHLDDKRFFSESERRQIQLKLNHIQYAGKEGADKGELGYEEIKFIAERVVLWCRKNRSSIRKNSDKTWLD